MSVEDDFTAASSVVMIDCSRASAHATSFKEDDLGREARPRAVAQHHPTAQISLVRMVMASTRMLSAYQAATALIMTLIFAPSQTIWAESYDLIQQKTAAN